MCSYAISRANALTNNLFVCVCYIAYDLHVGAYNAVYIIKLIIYTVVIDF